MTIHWPLSKLATMIVVAVRVITWNDRPTPEYQLVSAPLLLPVSHLSVPLVMQDRVGDFQ